MTFSRCIAAAVSSVLVGWGGVASASSFQLMEQNASGLGNAYAGQAAAAENASTVFYNPAGMARLPGTQFSVAITGLGPDIQFTDSGQSRSPIPGAIPLGGNGGDAGKWTALPAVYASYQINRSVWFGLGVTSPFGLQTNYDSTFVGRFQSQAAELKSYDINPSVAWQINDTLTLGAGVSYQHATFTLDRSTVTGFVPPVTVFTGATHLDVGDEAWGWNVGAMLNLGFATRLGISYRSSIGYDLSGTAATTGIPLVGGVAAPVTAKVRFPDTSSIAFAHDFNDQWELLGDFTYTHWGTIGTVPVVSTSPSAFGPAGATLDSFNFQFDNSFRIGLGINDKLSSSFTAKAGIAYDKSPVDAQDRLVALPDNDRTWLALGGKYSISKSTMLDFGYAHLFVRDGSINQTLPQQGTVNGTYSSRVDIISAQLSFAY